MLKNCNLKDIFLIATKDIKAKAYLVKVAVTMLYIACTEGGAMGQPKMLHPQQEAWRKPQEGAETRPLPLP